MRTVPTLLSLSLTLALLAWPAAADETALRRCRTLADAPARLACYDALPLAAPAVAATPAATPASTPPVAATFVLDIEGARRLPRVRRLE